MQSQDPHQEQSNLFATVIAQLQNGTTQAEASEMLSELVSACRMTNKVGEMNLKIKVRPDGNGQYFLEDQLTSKAPKMERGKTLFFGTPDGNLTRTDPKQRSLPLREVDDTQRLTELEDEKPQVRSI
ncbi:MAG: hypothetical protein K6L60_05435 [Oceanobacter sp.]